MRDLARDPNGMIGGAEWLIILSMLMLPVVCGLSYWLFRRPRIKLRCRSCGNLVDERSVYCSSCGSKL